MDNKVADAFTALTGGTLKLLLPPGGHFNFNRNYGYAIIMWNVDSLDWMEADEYRSGKITLEEAAQTIAERTLSKIKPGSIVLMHDIQRSSVEAFKIIYKELKAQGYKLVTVSELLGIDPTEHQGQYFYSSYNYGYQGKTYLARS